MSAQPEQLSILACRLFPAAAAATARDVERMMEMRRRMVRVDECMARLVINVLIPVQKSCILKGADVTIFTLFTVLREWCILHCKTVYAVFKLW